ncbi:MAG: N-acetylneuraminate synthase family protein [Candidatus Yonathbacteria bacterium]|nr:N-acetylneuraminate synthase family protein [Candidatus Yonathbacteria bacterium]
MGRERKQFFDGLPKNLTYEPVKVVKIGDRLVGEGQPVFVIAEVGANHRGKIENALKLIELASEAGADAIKFQHLKHDKIAADTVVYEEWHGKPVGVFSEFYKSAEMPFEWTEKLIAHAKKHNIMFLSSPFDKDAVNLLDTAGVPAFKVASYELTDDILLRHIARKGKPVILSTGMAYLEEVAHAVRVIQEEGNNEIVILHCISIYPPKSFADLNLHAIGTLREAFKVPVGYSDHSKPPYLAAPIAAVALKACVIEKHFTTERSGGSNDDPNSLEIDEFKRTVEEIRNTELALSRAGIKQPISDEAHALGMDEIADRWARRSLYATRDIPAGSFLGEDMITTLRPWGGIAPKDAGLVIGKKVLRDIKARSPITWEDFLETK